MTSKLNDYLFMATFLALSHDWDYEHQDKWPEVHCKKSIAQSPIDLCPNDMVPIKEPPILCQNWNKIYELSMVNNGHTIVLTLPSNQSLSFSEGGLPGIYKLVQFHFHWGSEHTLNGKRKALEAHFVGFNNKFKSIEEALDFTNGVAVLGVCTKLLTLVTTIYFRQ
ncbi:hypothetical protein WA026_016175 [Henosepilachna vigintioctopunctata]|uniref:carbonic anhydrase n=1 Tax=Henosepilachna vigintioctopunctata TaxID=420089 RepID=A0AAW1TP94_9CUCU